MIEKLLNTCAYDFKDSEKVRFEKISILLVASICTFAAALAVI